MAPAPLTVQRMPETHSVNASLGIAPFPGGLRQVPSTPRPGAAPVSGVFPSGRRFAPPQISLLCLSDAVQA